MKFHATLTHTPENCPGPKGGPPVTDWPARANEVDMELISAVQCQMSHQMFFVVETDDYAKLHQLFSPFQGISTAEFTPVRDLTNL
ncbi:MAG: hypothetical protein CL478_12710 [Acidobacteria bacterium]|nr:hypothetical protein [Acidobacteriota bacterium]